MSTVNIKNIFEDIKDASLEEVFEALLDNDAFRLERITSTGQSTPAGEWYDQNTDEWVMLIAGSAGISFRGQDGIITLKPGDYMVIPAHTAHRVEWTESGKKTLWLAIHYNAGQKM